MALKDLIASKASLAEDVIEQIVSNHIRYDTDHKQVAFTPEAHNLSNKAKILIYLVALQGWPFVMDEVVPVDAKPAEIEEHTGIPGGSLRPALKELKDRNIIIGRGGRYSVRAVALHTIQAELNGDSPAAKTLRPRKNVRGTGEKGPVTREPGTNGKKRTRGSSTSGLAERFQLWIDQGYFDEARTMADVQKRFHKEAIIVPQTSLPTYLLKAVRANQLTREKREVNGKTKWVYERSKN